VTDYVQNYQSKWKEHMNRMNTEKSQNKFYIISQEDRHYSDVRKIGHCNRPPRIILGEEEEEEEEEEEVEVGNFLNS
jgi:hypothetical protein